MSDDATPKPPPTQTVTVSPEVWKRIGFGFEAVNYSFQGTAPDRLNLPATRSLSTLGQTYAGLEPPGHAFGTSDLLPFDLKANVWGRTYILAPTPQRLLLHQVVFPEPPTPVTMLWPPTPPVSPTMAIVQPIVPLWLLPPLKYKPTGLKEFLQDGIDRDPIIKALPDPIKNLLKENLADLAVDQSDAALTAAADAIVARITADPATKGAVENVFTGLKAQFLEGKKFPGGGERPFPFEAPAAVAPAPLPFQGKLSVFGLTIIHGLSIKGSLDADFHVSHLRPGFDLP